MIATTQELAILITGKNTAGKAFESASKSAGGFGKALSDVSKIAGGFVLGAALTQLPKLFDGPIKAASDLGESINAVQVVFGKTSDKIIEFGKTSATQVGLSARAFNELATPLGAFLKNTGMGMDQVADQTINLTKRASDMASVFNTSVDDALGAITSALRGEANPIERYGVSVNAAKVEMEALAMTGKKTTASLTDQEKSAARLKLIFDQTNAVAGDFVNTSDGLANKQRIQAARSEEVSAALGAKLMPVMLKFKELQLQVVEALASKLIPALEDLSAKYMPQIAAAFDSAVAAVTPLIEKIQPFFEALSQNEEVMNKVAVVVGGVLVAAFAALAVSAGAAAIGVIAAVAPFVLIGAAIAALALGIRELVIHWDEIQAKFPVLGQVVDVLVLKFNELRAYIDSQLGPAIVRIKDRLVDVVTAIVTFLQQNWGLIKDIMVGAVTVAYDLLKIPFEAIRGLFTVIVDVINGDWSKAWDDFKDLAVNAVNNTLDLIKDAFALWKDVAKLLYTIGEAIIQGLWDGMKGKWDSVKNWLSDAAKSIPGAIGDVLKIHSPSKVMYDLGEDTMQGYINGLVSKYGGVKAAIAGIEDLIGPGAYEDAPAVALQKMLGISKGDAAQLWRTLTSESDATADSLSNLRQNIPHFNTATNSFVASTDKIGGALTGVIPQIGSLGGAITQVTADFWSAAEQFKRAYPSGTGSGSSAGGASATNPGGSASIGGSGSYTGPIDLSHGYSASTTGAGVFYNNPNGMGLTQGYQGVNPYPYGHWMNPGPQSQPSAATVINVTVQGSVVSGRELVGVIRDELGGGAGRGVI